MPLQKRRMGRGRIHHRRSAWARNARNTPNVSACPNCGNARVPHRVCASCGFYRDRLVMQVKVDDDE